MDWDQWFCRTERCSQTRLVHVCASKLLDEALLVIISFKPRHWQFLSITDTFSAIGITELVA